MTAPACERITLADFTDYTAGDLPEAAAGAIEDHLFSCADCAARAAQFEALLAAVRAAVRAADVGGFVNDAILNALARDGVRVRTFALAPGAAVPCAVWDDDELLVMRMRGDFTGATALTLSQHIAGREVVRATCELPASGGEVAFAVSAAWVRQLPPTDVAVQLATTDDGVEKTIGRYTLIHGGSLHRR